MDDFVIIHHNKHYLMECLEKIRYQLNNVYHLQINNNNKTKITSLKQGFTFLAYHIQITNKKAIMKLRGETLNKIKKNIKLKFFLYTKEQLSFGSLFSLINTYRYSLK